MTENDHKPAESAAAPPAAAESATESATDQPARLKGPEQPPGEIGGPHGPEPTRFGDWAFKGRCSDF